MAGLLSLPAPVAGLLGPGVEANARNMALMQVAGALLQAGGPNMRPTSPGQALGAAVPGAMATYQNTINSGIQQGLLGRQIEQQDAQAAREAQQRQAMEQYVSTLPADQQALARAYGDDIRGIRQDQMSEKEFAAQQEYRRAQQALASAASARAAAAARMQMQAAQQAMEDAKRERVARERIANAAAMGGVDMAGNPVNMKGLLLGTQAGQEAAVNSLLAREFPKPGEMSLGEIYDEATGRERKVFYNKQTGQVEPVGGVAAPKSPLVNVDMGGKLPVGYRLNAQGEAEPIPGTPQAMEATGFASKADTAMRALNQKQDIVLSKIEDALKGVNYGTAGLLGAVPVPGFANYDLAQTLDTIKANLGFDELQQLRDASPTGGALGQVTERELSFLQAVAGSLDPRQSPPKLRDNLEQIRNYLVERRKARQDAFAQTFGATERPRVPVPDLSGWTDLGNGVRIREKR